MLVHFIENGVVINTVQQDTLDNPFGYLAAASETARIGWTYAGGVFTAPPPPAPTVPASVTRRQARQALLLRGKLNLVQPAIDAIPDATQRGLIQIEWDDSQVFERNRASLVALASAIGLTSAETDELFIFAATL